MERSKRRIAFSILLHDGTGLEMTAEDLMDLEEELAARGIEAGDICAVFIP